MELEQKKTIVSDLRAQLSNAVVTVLTDYHGLNVAEMTDLRNQLREAGAYYRVVKNTLTKRAIDGFDYASEFKAHLKGTIGIVWALEDPISPAKVLREFAKKYEKFSVSVAALDGVVYSGEQLKKLADMPSKDELRARLLGTIQAVPAKFLSVLEAVPRDFIRVLAARKKDLEEKSAQ